MPPEATDPSAASYRVDQLRPCHKASAVVGCQQIAPRSDRDRLPLSDARIKTKSLGCGNGLSCKRLGGDIAASGPGRSHPLLAKNSKQRVASRSVVMEDSS